MKTKGFTLIELLIVVLIIGVLAVAALPQYSKTVERSRFSQAMTVLSALDRGIQMHIMEEGGYPAKGIKFAEKELLEMLPVDIDITMGSNGAVMCTKDFRFNFYCETTQYNSRCEIAARRINNALNSSGTDCNSGGYILYQLIYRYSDDNNLKGKYCDAYESNAKWHYPGKQGVPTMVCEIAKSTGMVDRIVTHLP